MTNIRATLPDVIRSDLPFSARIIHVFPPIYTHVMSRDGLGVKSPVKIFKMKKYQILEDIA